MTHLVLLAVLFASIPAVPNDPPPADPLIALAMRAPLAICSVCTCCSGMCSQVGAVENTPAGINEPGYCGDPCIISDECTRFAGILGNRTLGSVLADAWDRAVRGDYEGLEDLASEFAGLVTVNHARKAVQFRSCEGLMVAHIPIRERALTSAASLD